MCKICKKNAKGVQKNATYGQKKIAKVCAKCVQNLCKIGEMCSLHASPHTVILQITYQTSMHNNNSNDEGDPPPMNYW